MDTKRFISTKKFRPLKAIATFLLSAFLMVSTAGCASINEDRYKEYANDAQIEKLANALGFDLADANTFGNYQIAQFVHNGGNPIQVVLQPELKPYKAQIKEGLDLFFNVLHSVNNKYSYAFVEEPNEDDSVITFETDDIPYEDVGGTVDKFTSPYNASKLTDKLLLNKGSVILDLELYEQLKESAQASLVTHEILHFFSVLRDQYNSGVLKNTDEHQANTFIKTELASKIPMLTPYDVSAIQSIYTPQATDDADFEAKLQACRDYLANYTKEYYNCYTTYVNESTSTELELPITSFGAFTYEESFTFTYAFIEDILTENWEDSERYSCSYEITYKNNGYTFKIYGENSTLIDECSGEAVIANGVMVLRNVQLESGLRPNHPSEEAPNGYIQDLALVKPSREVYLFDFYTSSFKGGTITLH